MVFVDDHSQDNTAYRLHSYLKQNPRKVNNRIQIIRNARKVGHNANAYFYIKQFCNHKSIAVVIGDEDYLVGYQTFQVINSVYQNPNTWYAYSNYAREDE